MVAAVGVRETVTGGAIVTVAVALLVASAVLVAVTVMVCGLPSVAGAVYRPPLEIVPTAGLNDHETLGFNEPATVAENCCVWPTPRLTVPGDTVTVTGGVTVTFAVADWVGSCTLVAVTVTDRGLETEAGPTYRPVFDTVPTVELPPVAPFTDHVTAVFVVPVTAAVNC
jgi:hypothetical protein